jgi:putative flippase GtrA
MINSQVYDRLKSHIWELGRFGVIGVIKTIIGLIIIFVPYNLWGVNYILCNIAGYFVGFVIGFILHKNWVFKSNKIWDTELIPYFVTFCIGYIINIMLLVLFVKKLMINKNISQVIAIFGFTATTYLLNKFWTFAKK